MALLKLKLLPTLGFRLAGYVGGFMWQRTAETFEGEFILRNEGNMKTDLLY